MQGQNLHLLLLLLFFGFSAISWVVGKLREQAAIKKARDEMKRARDEQLRTGRVSEPPGGITARGGEAVGPARSSELNELRELAMKRQRQLEQMREMQQQSVQAQRTAARTQARDPRQVQGPVAFPIPGIPLPTPKPVPGGMGGPGGPGVPRAPKAPKQPKQRAANQGQRGMNAGAGSGVQNIRPGQPGMKPRPRAAYQGEQTFDAPAFREIRQATPRRLVSDAAPPAPGEIGSAEGTPRRAASLGLAALLGLSEGGRPSASEVRRAVILSEIFGPPVSSRRAESGAGSA